MPGATSVPGSTARETLARAVQPFRLMPGPPKRGLSRQLEQVPQSSAAAAAAAAAAPTSLGGSAVAVDREDEAPDAAESTREMEGPEGGRESSSEVGPSGTSPASRSRSVGMMRNCPAERTTCVERVAK